MSWIRTTAVLWALITGAGGCRFGFDAQEGPEPPPPPPPAAPELGPIHQLTDATVDSNNPAIGCGVDRCLVLRHLGPTGDRRAHAILVDPEGAPIGADVNVSQNEGGHTSDAAIAWGSGRFGVAWNVDGAISFRTLSSDGTPASPVVRLSPEGELHEDPTVAFVAGRFLVAYDRCGDQSIRGMLIGIDGTPLEEERLIAPGRNPSLSFDGSQLFLAVAESSDMTLLELDRDGKVTGTPLSLGRGSKPVLSAVPGSRAITFLDTRSGQPDIFLRIEDGGGKQEVELSNDPARETEPAIASSGRDRLVAWDGDGGPMPALTWGALVTLVPTTTVSVFPLSELPGATTSHPGAAWVGDRYLVVWEERTSGSDQILVRTVTPPPR